SVTDRVRTRRRRRRVATGTRPHLAGCPARDSHGSRGAWIDRSERRGRFVIKHGMLAALSLAAMCVTAYITAPYVVSAFRRTSVDGGSPAKAGHYVRSALYEANCAGCHGADGRGGAARGLTDPVFLRIADEETM